MAGQVVVNENVVIMTGTRKSHTWTVQNFKQGQDDLSIDSLPFPDPFANVKFQFYARRSEMLYISIYSNKAMPEAFEIHLRVVGKKVDEFHDLSSKISATEFGGRQIMTNTEFTEKWLQENGSLVVECEILPKNVKVREPPRRDLLLSKAFEDESFVDFKLVCEGKEIKIAKAIVGPQSEFFRGMFESNMEESKNGQAEITNMLFVTLEMLINYLYSGQIDEKLITRDVLIAADYLNILSVKEIFEEFAPRNFCVDTITETLNSS